jgi:adenylate cyclase
MLAIWAHTQNISAIKQQACSAAIEISKTINQQASSNVTAALRTRLGLHAGKILLGNIGAGDHFEYRPVGDIVNTASRIEGLNKHLGTRILATEEVVSGLTQIPVRALGSFLLKGKTVPVNIYEIKDHQSPVQAETIFTRGLAAFMAGQFSDAEQHFSEVLRLTPDDGPSLYYSDLCRHYRLNPPSEKWKGTVVITNK